MPPKKQTTTHDRGSKGTEAKQQIWRTKDLATALLAPPESSEGGKDFGPMSDVNRFPAMRMLLMKADEDHADKPTKKLINSILDKEQVERTDYLLHAEWVGKRGAAVEHVQGRVNNLTYHFMFGLARGVDGPQYTDGADAFIAIYRNSVQKLDDIIVRHTPAPSLEEPDPSADGRPHSPGTTRLCHLPTRPGRVPCSARRCFRCRTRAPGRARCWCGSCTLSSTRGAWCRWRRASR